VFLAFAVLSWCGVLLAKQYNKGILTKKKKKKKKKKNSDDDDTAAAALAAGAESRADVSGTAAEADVNGNGAAAADDASSSSSSSSSSSTSMLEADDEEDGEAEDENDDDDDDAVAFAATEAGDDDDQENEAADDADADADEDEDEDERDKSSAADEAEDGGAVAATAMLEVRGERQGRALGHRVVRRKTVRRTTKTVRRKRRGGKKNKKRGRGKKNKKKRGAKKQDQLTGIVDAGRPKNLYKPTDAQVRTVSTPLKSRFEKSKHARNPLSLRKISRAMTNLHLLRRRDARQRARRRSKQLMRRARSLARQLGLKPLRGDAYPFFRRADADLRKRMLRQARTVKRLVARTKRLKLIRNHAGNGQYRKSVQQTRKAVHALNLLRVLTHNIGCVVREDDKRCAFVKGSRAIPSWARKEIRTRVTALKSAIKRRAAKTKTVRRQTRTVTKRTRTFKKKEIKRVKQYKAKAKKVARRARTWEKEAKSNFAKSDKEHRTMRGFLKAWRATEDSTGAAALLRRSKTDEKVADSMYKMMGSQLTPATPVLAPGMGADYNKLLSKYLYLLSIAL
jgi:hypothetical protein